MTHDEMWQALDRGADGVDEVDFATTAWSEGRRVRRRRQALTGSGLVVGGAAAVALAFTVLGGGELGASEPMVATSTPTVAMVVTDDPTATDSTTGTGTEVTSTLVVKTTSAEQSASATPSGPSTAPVPSPAQPTTTDATATGPSIVPAPSSPEPTLTDAPADEPTTIGALALTAGTVGGVPLTAPASDVLAALTLALGEPDLVTLDRAATGCDGSGPYGDTYHWDDGLTFATSVVDGLDVGWQWTVQSTSDRFDLPGGLAPGTPEPEVRAAHTVVEETITGGGSPVLVLDTGMGLVLDPGTGVVLSVTMPYIAPC
jgi:hypothetical protein